MIRRNSYEELRSTNIGINQQKRRDEISNANNAEAGEESREMKETSEVAINHGKMANYKPNIITMKQ